MRNTFINRIHYQLPLRAIKITRLSIRPFYIRSHSSWALLLARPLS